MVTLILFKSKVLFNITKIYSNKTSF